MNEVEFDRCCLMTLGFSNDNSILVIVDGQYGLRTGQHIWVNMHTHVQP